MRSRRPTTVVSVMPVLPAQGKTSECFCYHFCFGFPSVMRIVGNCNYSKFLFYSFLLVDISTSFGENFYANCHSSVTGKSI